MSYCSFCGKEVPHNNSAFCMHCGKSLMGIHNEASSDRNCPFCGQAISQQAACCTHCGKSFTNNGDVVTDDTERWECPRCGALISVFTDRCNFCKHVRLAKEIPFACPHCGRDNSRSSAICQFCGKQMQAAEIARSNRQDGKLQAAWKSPGSKPPQNIIIFQSPHG
jgi:hypothetical protein